MFTTKKGLLMVRELIQQNHIIRTILHMTQIQKNKFSAFMVHHLAFVDSRPWCSPVLCSLPAGRQVFDKAVDSSGK